MKMTIETEQVTASIEISDESTVYVAVENTLLLLEIAGYNVSEIKQAIRNLH